MIIKPAAQRLVDGLRRAYMHQGFAAPIFEGQGEAAVGQLLVILQREVFQGGGAQAPYSYQFKLGLQSQRRVCGGRNQCCTGAAGLVEMGMN